MSDQPHERHSDDTIEDDGPPTDAFTDEVREDAANAEEGDAGSDRASQGQP